MRATDIITKLGLALAIMVTSLVSIVPSASAHEWYYWERTSAECEAPGVMRHITRRFAHQAEFVHHRPEWRIDAIDEVHQHRYLEQDIHKARPVPRRYCHAKVHFNDGSERVVWYLVEGGQGFATFMGHKIEFCIDGLDTANIYNRNCSILR